MNPSLTIYESQNTEYEQSGLFSSDTIILILHNDNLESNFKVGHPIGRCCI